RTCWSSTLRISSVLLTGCLGCHGCETLTPVGYQAVGIMPRIGPLVMYGGRIVEAGETEDVFERPLAATARRAIRRADRQVGTLLRRAEQALKKEGPLIDAEVGVWDKTFEVNLRGYFILFAYHGYPWLIHRLTYRRRNHDNLHVR